MAPVAALDRVRRFVGARVGGVVADDAHFAKHARGNRPGIVDFDRVDFAQLHPAGGDEPQHMRPRVVHQQRRAARADDGGHFPQDPVRRFIQPDRVPEDLADRVDQVDFLVPP